MRRFLIFLLMLSVLVISCKRIKNTEGVTNSADEEPQLGFGTEEQMEEVFIRFPSPDEMLSIFEKEGFEYSSHLLLSPDKTKQYLDSKSQSLNLGVYMADLAYLTLFEQTQEAHKYMLSIYNLSDKLRISSAFDFKLVKRLEDNVRNADSLKAISMEAMNGLNSYLERNNKDRTFVLISIGGYIEALYLSVSMVGDFSADNPFIQRISDQRFVLNNLVNFALRYSSDKNVSETIELVHPIRMKFNELIVSKNETKVEKDEDGKLIVTGGSKYEITEEQYNELRQLVLSTRKSIVENQ